MVKLLLVTTIILFSSNCFSSALDPKLDPTEGDGTEQSRQVDLGTDTELRLSTEPVDSNELVCVRERVTGTHIKRKICRTRGQIEAERLAAEKFMKSLRATPRAATIEPN